MTYLLLNARPHCGVVGDYEIDEPSRFDVLDDLVERLVARETQTDEIRVAITSSGAKVEMVDVDGLLGILHATGLAPTTVTVPGGDTSGSISGEDGTATLSLVGSSAASGSSAVADSSVVLPVSIDMRQPMVGTVHSGRRIDGTVALIAKACPSPFSTTVSFPLGELDFAFSAGRLAKRYVRRTAGADCASTLGDLVDGVLVNAQFAGDGVTVAESFKGSEDTGSVHSNSAWHEAILADSTCTRRS